MAEVYQHCVFVCSNYTTGTRKGLHFLYNDLNLDRIMDMVRKYTAKEGVAFYSIITNKPNVESVQEKDGFFKSIDILEGHYEKNVISFNNAINNQITVMDVALLLLSREKMTVKDLKTYLFYIYSLYAKENGSFPFKEKCFLDEQIVGFKNINKEFDPIFEKRQDAKLACTKPNIIMSKFFNCEGGVELLNKVLKIFYNLKQCDVDYLNGKIKEYLKKAKRMKRNKRYLFGLTKKSIDKISINCN